MLYLHIMNKRDNAYNPRPSRLAVNAVEKAVCSAVSEGRNPRVLFVCLGNICRSPAAQAITEKMARDKGIGVECDSAGFYGGHAGELPDPRMRQAAFQRGYRLEHRSRKIHGYDLDEFDLVIGMDDNNLRDLHNLALTDTQAEKIVRMTDFACAHPQYDAVPDPYYEGAAGFQLVLDLLEDACSELLDLLNFDEGKCLKDK